MRPLQRGSGQHPRPEPETLDLQGLAGGKEGPGGGAEGGPGGGDIIHEDHDRGAIRWGDEGSPGAEAAQGEAADAHGALGVAFAVAGRDLQLARSVFAREQAYDAAAAGVRGCACDDEGVIDAAAHAAATAHGDRDQENAGVEEVGAAKAKVEALAEQRAKEGAGKAVAAELEVADHGIERAPVWTETDESLPWAHLPSAAAAPLGTDLSRADGLSAAKAVRAFLDGAPPVVGKTVKGGRRREVKPG